MMLPRDDAPIRTMVGLSNRWGAIRGNPFRVHVHRAAAVLAVAIAAGLVPVSVHRGLIWQAMVFERTAT